MEVLTDADGWILIGIFKVDNEFKSYSSMVRSQWQAFRSNSELLTGWNYPASRDEKRTDGIAGEEQLRMSDTFPKNKFSKFTKNNTYYRLRPSITVWMSWCLALSRVLENLEWR